MTLFLMSYMLASLFDLVFLVLYSMLASLYDHVSLVLYSMWASLYDLVSLVLYNMLASLYDLVSVVLYVSLIVLPCFSCPIQHVNLKFSLVSLVLYCKVRVLTAHMYVSLKIHFFSLVLQYIIASLDDLFLLLYICSTVIPKVYPWFSCQPSNLSFFSCPTITYIRLDWF